MTEREAIVAIYSTICTECGVTYKTCKLDDTGCCDECLYKLTGVDETEETEEWLNSRNTLK